MMVRLYSAVFACAVLLAPVSSTFAADRAGVEFFERHIRPLLIRKCYSCHSRKAKKKAGGLWLDTAQALRRGGDSGPAILPGQPSKSLLIKAVKRSGDLQMPPETALTKLEVARLIAWVRRGAPDPRVSVPTANTARPADPIAGKKHWAFRPLATRVPTDRGTDWPRGTIDRYIWRRLRQRGLEPAADAPPDVWLRRVYVQLTGLQPTPGQLRSFQSDRRVDARARIVDRLLASPAFGVRWGRHWLDLARYADSNGLDENFLHRHAWRFRNWTIQNVNEDVPYDRFVTLQLAGDLLSHTSIEQRDRQRVGTGFLLVGPKILIGDSAARQRMEIADEQIDTLGRAILAQTLGCARCHDHKFDPFPTRDYYALAGIFTSTKVMERRLMLGSQRRMAHLVGLGKGGPAGDDAFEKYHRDLPTLKKQVAAAQDVLKRVQSNRPIPKSVVANAVAPAVRKSGQSKAVRIAAQKKLLKTLTQRMARRPVKPPRAMITLEGEKIADEAIRIAGQFDRLGRRVPRGFLQVLSQATSKRKKLSGSGRLELAKWLFDARGGAGSLTARVMANRVWHHLIGRGLVRTVDNFGRRGERPTHPELLDHLAQRFMDHGWSIKSLIREIVLSRTFAMSSVHNGKAHRVDPENRWLWRAHRRRLDPESLRDNILAISLQLDLRNQESTVDYLGDQATGVGVTNRRRTNTFYRSIYLPVIRNDLPELFEVFDFANPHFTTGARPRTTVPTQGLFLLNDEQVQEAAERLADRILRLHRTTESRIEACWENIFGSAATSEELRRVAAFVRETEHRLTERWHDKPQLKSWSLMCHALLASSRFQFID